MILLGAGASKFFGLKTLQDLTFDLVEKMKKIGHEETIIDITEGMKRFGLTPDFESIYTTLEALTNLQDGIRRSGGLAAYILYKTNYEISKGHNIVTQYKDVLSDFREMIYKECSIAKGMIENKGKILDSLFRALREYSEPRYLSTKTGGEGFRIVHVCDTIVTTNYDMAVELYHRMKRLTIADGFRLREDRCTLELDFSEYGRNPTSDWLIKLHGSIWQFRQDGSIIQTIAEPKSLPLNISVGEQMMIYPVGEKPILQHPYFSFYSIFREQPWETLVAIGHSFRDDPLNIAILERLSTRPPPRTKLIIVNPEAENAVRNLGSPSEDIEQRIIRISEPFEDNEKLFKNILTAAGCKNWNEYQRTTSPKY